MASLHVKPEEDAWIVAACKVLSQRKTPLHYTQIKQHLMQSGLVGPNTKSSLETALVKESEVMNGRVHAVEGKPGVFALAQSVSSAQSSLGRPHMSPSTSAIHHNGVSKRDKHYYKYIRLKRLVKNMVFLNAAICDEVVRLEEKVIRVKDERRFLVRRLIQQQMNDEPSDPSPPVPLTSTPQPSSSASSSSRPSSQSVAQLLGEVEKRKKKAMAPPPAKGGKKRASAPVTPAVPEEKARPKKAKVAKRFVTPIPLDNTGRPVFPIELGTLTVYCLGEIIPKAGYASIDAIYPVGFCSTREFISIHSPPERCLYTCKIYDGKLGPTFELSADDSFGHEVTGSTPDECHAGLIRAINQSLGHQKAIPVEPYGADFFGLSHPTIQNLIQYCPGAKKCPGYRWQKFEIAKDGAPHTESEITVNVELLLRSPLFSSATGAASKMRTDGVK